MLMHRCYRKCRNTLIYSIYRIVKYHLAMCNNVSFRYDHMAIIGFNSTSVLLESDKITELTFSSLFDKFQRYRE